VVSSHDHHDENSYKSFGSDVDFASSSLLELVLENNPKIGDVPEKVEVPSVAIEQENHSPANENQIDAPVLEKPVMEIPVLETPQKAQLK
jgi:hypothetical protein